MFFDWLTIEQDFGFQIPLNGEFAYMVVNLNTGVTGAYSIPTFQHKGSSCDSVSIKISGSKLRLSGNPSRWGRLDNLFGLQSVDLCVNVFNQILDDLGLPRFTKCTQIKPKSLKGSKVELLVDGAIIKELHITSNRMVGKGNIKDYLAGVSTLNYRYSVPRLHSNGNTVDWLSKQGKAHLIFPSIYNKSNEIELHSLKKIKNKFGENSLEYKYLTDIINYCDAHGVVRFEQKLKSRYLQKHGLHYWGLSSYSKLNQLHKEFLDLDKKLSVNAMDFETISEQLLRCGVVETTRSANTTAMYAIQWMHGQTFDCNKSHIQTHRARLRKVGIDIMQRCNLSKFNPIIVKEVRTVEISDCPIPNWYKMPQIFKVA